MTIVEIWMGGVKRDTIQAKKIDVNLDGAFVKITDPNGYEIETSPHNVIIVHEKKKEGE